jgi:Arc/MetJ-type ribon-helix-helix transcriptional regulator
MLDDLLCNMRYSWAMASITIRTDAGVEKALEELTRDGKSRSEAIREAILLAYRERRHARLRAEAEALRDDPEDVAASRQLAAEMESIRAW